MTPSTPQSFSNIVGPGQTVNVAISGTQFYFPVATGQFYARQNGGAWALFVQGTGQKCGAPFYSVSIQNPGTQPLVFQIVASDEGFIDHRLVPNLSNQNVIPLPYPASAWVHDAGLGVYVLSVPDLTGTTFLDAAGNKWIAMSRSLLSVQSFNTVQTYVYDLAVADQNLLGIVQSQAAMGGAVQPAISFAAAGNFVLAITPNEPSEVSAFEIYQAVSPGYAANPPS